MKRFLIALTVLALCLGGTACVKFGAKGDVKADGSVALSMNFGIKGEALEMLRAQLESMADMAGEEAGGDLDEALEKFDEVDGMFDEARLKAKMKESGIDVTSSKITETGGWKNVEIQGVIKDVNAWVDKMAAETKKELAKAEESGEMPFALPKNLALTPRFFKTTEQGIGELQIFPPLASLFEGLDENPLDALDMLDDMDESELQQFEQYMDMMKGMFSLNEMSFEMTVNLPGEVTAVKGLKKVGTNGVRFGISGDALTLDNIKGLFGLKEGVSARFKIPAECKINFVDRPAKTAPPAKKDAQESDAEEEKKKGGVKIGSEGEEGR